MKFWRSRLGKLWLPEHAVREADAQAAAGHRNPLWPMCHVCSKEHGKPVDVTEYGVKDHGKMIGGEYWTAFYAKCHGEEDVMRIEGFRFDRWSEGQPDYVARVAAVAALPFFAPGADRRIPASVLRNFIAGSYDERAAKDEAS